MPPEVQARALEPFYTTKGEKGTGLGLAQVFGTVERHGGRVEIVSAPGAGATFRLELPAGQRPHGAVGHEAAPSSCRLRIRAVDDEPRLLRMTSLMLRQAGHAVVTAASAEEALERLADEPVDLVLSDLGLGSGMNGWELAEVIREGWPAVRVVLATGWGSGIDPEAARARGVEAVLAKPYQQADLLRAVAGRGSVPSPSGRGLG
jgi:CheY-like chemotaxis protein